MKAYQAGSTDETTCSRGRQGRAWRVAVAFLSGVVLFLVLFQLGDVARPWVLVCAGAAAFLVCQYLLSRGNPQAARTDVGMVLAMNALPVALLVGTFAVGVKGNAAAELLRGVGGVCLGLGCSYAGAVLAARTARA